MTTSPPPPRQQRSRRLLGSILLPLVLALGPAVAAAAAPLPWRVCLPDAALPPYLNNAPQRLGVTERLLIDAGEAAGLAVELLRQPPRRCRQLLQQGQIEATLAAFVPGNRELGLFPMRQELPQLADPARRLAHLRVIWVRRADQALEWDGRRLSGVADPGTLTVGVRRSILSVIEAVQALELRVDDAAFGTAQLLDKLVAGRVDLVAGIEQDLRHAMRGDRYPTLVALEPPLRSLDFYAVLARDLDGVQRARGERWWDEMARLRELPPYRPDWGSATTR